MPFDLLDQMEKTRMKSGLSSRETNPIDPALKRTESAENGFERNRTIPLRIKDERMIMAVRTAEIAIRKEENGTNLPGPIDEGSFQKSFDLDVHIEFSGDRELMQTHKFLLPPTPPTYGGRA